MRDGVVLLLFDVSSETKNNRKEYRTLVKTLKREGYLSLQKSVFYKYIRNISMYPYEVRRIKELRITEGDVYSLPLSFRLFSKMIAIHGELPDMERIKTAFLYY